MGFKIKLVLALFATLYISRTTSVGPPPQLSQQPKLYRHEIIAPLLNMPDDVLRKLIQNHIYDYQHGMVQKESITDAADEEEYAIQLHNYAMEIVLACTPRIRETGGPKFVLLWKFVAALQISGVPRKDLKGAYLKVIADSMTFFATKILPKPDDINYDFGRLLTIGSHSEIVKYLNENNAFAEQGKMCVAYMRLLQRVQAIMAKTVPFWLMVAMKQVEYTANAQDLIDTIEAKPKEDINYKPKFALSWKLYKGKEPSPDEISRFNLFTAKTAAKELQNNYGIQIKLNTEKLTSPSLIRQYAIAYCAVHELVGKLKPRDLPYESRLNLALFDAELKHNVVAKLRKATEKDFKGSKVLDTSLAKQLEKFDDIHEEEIPAKSNEHSYRALVTDIEYPDKSAPFKYKENVTNGLIDEIDEAIDSNNYPDYANLLEVIRLPLATKLSKKDKGPLYNFFFTMASTPRAYSAEDKLLLVDRLHNSVFEPLLTVRELKYVDSTAVLGARFETLFKNFDSILSGTTADNIKNKVSSDKLRILVKCALALADGAFKKTSLSAWAKKLDVNVLKQRLTNVLTKFFDLAHSKDRNVICDGILWTEWRLFNEQTFSEIKNLYLDENFQKNVFIRGVEKGAPNNALVYLSLMFLTLRYSKRTDESKRKVPGKITGHIMVLGEAIDDIETVESSLVCHEYAQTKYGFYCNNRDNYLGFHQDLKTYCEKLVDMIYNGLFHIQKKPTSEQQEQMLYAVVDTIKRDRLYGQNDKLRETLGTDLIGAIDHLFYRYIFGSKGDARAKAQAQYDIMHMVLGPKDSRTITVRNK